MPAAQSEQERIAQTLIETGTAESPKGNVHLTELAGWHIVLEWEEGAQPVSSIEHVDGMDLVHFDFTDAPGAYHITVQQPFIDIYRTWAGSIDCWRGSELTSVAMNFGFDTAVNRNLPVICNYSRQGENRGVVGLLDQVPLTHVHQRLFFPMRPPLTRLQTKFSRNSQVSNFRESVVINRQPHQFGDALRAVFAYCRQAMSIVPMPTPDWAFEPVWCSWYSHLYTLTQQNIVDQLPHLNELGFRTIIIDASWFKPMLKAMGHVWGDYEVREEFFPNLAELVHQAHANGLKVLLWCAPWYIGKEANCHDAMEPYCIWDGKERIGRLCPACPESREHARKICERLMRDYNLDGLKIDFMDRVGEQCMDPKHDHGDGQFGTAMADFMATIRDAVLGVNPDAAIEYRVSYSTLASQPYANCQRGNDSPFDADYIRRENIYLRLFCDYPSAVWSDYAYWHPEESPANAALMLCEQFFSGGVPTVSLDLTTTNAEHLAQLKEWLAFYNEHRQILAKATPVIHSADSSLSISSLQHLESGQAYLLIAGQHIPAKLALKPGITTVWILNASAETAGKLTLTAGDKSVSLAIDGQGPIRVTI